MRSACHAILAAAFLAWWLPQDMGVRPEGVVCVCAAAAMHAVLDVAWRRERLAVAWLAFALAGLGFAAHPTGFTLLAPLLAGLPLLWRLVAVPGHRAATALRVVAVASGGMVAPLLAFVNGGLRDFLRGQRIFLAIQAQESWATEIQRYDFLLTQIPMGNYAKRMAVLLCLVSPGVVRGAGRRGPDATGAAAGGAVVPRRPRRRWRSPRCGSPRRSGRTTSGRSRASAPRSSRCFLALAVPTVRSVLETKRLPFGLVAAAAGSYVLAIALSWHGPNQWPYAWLDGVRRPEFPPAIKRVLLDSPLLWLLVLAVVVVALTVPTRMVGTRDPRLNVLRAVPILAVIALVGTSVYTVFTFGLAAVQGVPRSSLWAQSLADPTASRCAAAAGTEVLDPFTAVPLTEAPGLPAPPPATGFVNNGGFYAGNRPQGVAGDRVWGSLVARDGALADSTQGRLTTSWYGLPDRLRGHGHGDRRGQPLRRRRADGGVRPPLGRCGRTGGHRGPHRRRARSVVADPDPRAARRRGPGAAGGRRRVGHDQRVAGVVRPRGGPSRAARRLPPAPRTRRARVAAGLRAGPAKHQPGIVNGITEPAAFGVLWGAKGALSGFSDGAWQASRGGAFAQVPRSQSVLELATVEPADPDVQVAVFGSDLGRDRYTLTEDRHTVGGASTATGPRTERLEPPPYGRSVLSPPRSALRHADPGTRGDSRPRRGSCSPSA